MRRRHVKQLCIVRCRPPPLFPAKFGECAWAPGFVSTIPQCRPSFCHLSFTIALAGLSLVKASALEQRRGSVFTCAGLSALASVRCSRKETFFSWIAQHLELSLIPSPLGNGGRLIRAPEVPRNLPRHRSPVPQIIVDLLSEFQPHLPPILYCALSRLTAH